MEKFLQMQEQLNASAHELNIKTIRTPKRSYEISFLLIKLFMWINLECNVHKSAWL